MKYEEMIDPEIASGIDMLSDEMNIAVVEDPPAARANLAKIADMILSMLPPTDVAITERVISLPDRDIKIYVYQPPSEGLRPALLWLHGGGFIIGEGRDDVVAVPIAERVGCVVVSPRYRLAPENPFPDGIEDAYSTLLWMVENAEDLHIDINRIAIGGISAGGGMTAGLALLNRDRGGPKLKLQILNAPMLDDKHNTSSGQLSIPAKFWNKELSFKAWKLYLGEAYGGDVSPYAVPSHANDLSGLPPAYLCVGNIDLFRDDVINYAQRLMAAGVPSELKVYGGGYHAFDLFSPQAAISKRLINGYIDALNRAFA